MEQTLLAFVTTLDTTLKNSLKPVGNISLSVSQVVYIKAIHELGEPTLSELAEALEFSKASVTTAINRLLEQGYVVKTQSQEDKRVFRVKLTPLSESVIQAREKALKAYLAMIRKVLTPAEAKQLESLLKKLVTHFDKGVTP
jgi:DNA-binding MarR family transcriptional regulator